MPRRPRQRTRGGTPPCGARQATRPAGAFKFQLPQLRCLDSQHQQQRNGEAKTHPHIGNCRAPAQLS